MENQEKITVTTTPETIVLEDGAKPIDHQMLDEVGKVVETALESPESLTDTVSDAAVPSPEEDGTKVPEEAKPQTEEERKVSRWNMLKALAGMNINGPRPRTALSDKERAHRKVKRDMAKASRKQNRKNRK